MCVARKKKVERGDDSEEKKQYECDECGKSYKQSSSLITHKRLHSGQRPFRCVHCHKTFVQSGHLTSHLRLHTGIKPHACNVCGKRFGSTGDLKVTYLLIYFNSIAGTKPMKKKKNIKNRNIE